MHLEPAGAAPKQSTVFIVEGPDCAGKTTFVNSQVFMGEFKHHQGPYSRDPFEETMEFLDRHCGRRNVIVCDRLHIGEHVYGPLFRSRDALGRTKSRILARRLLREHTCVIFAMPPREVVLRNFAESKVEQLPQRSLDVERIYDGYVKQMEGSQLPYVTYDYTRGEKEQYLTFGRAIKACSAPHNPGYYGYGSLAPGNVLFLTPFSPVGLDPANLVLTEALDLLDVNEQGMYWCRKDLAKERMSAQFRPRMVVEVLPGADRVDCGTFSWSGYTGVRLGVPTHIPPDVLAEILGRIVGEVPYT